MKKNSVLAKRSGCQDVVTVNSSRQLSTSVSPSSQLPLMAQEGLDEGSLADLRSS